jgi:hypothetical protein
MVYTAAVCNRAVPLRRQLAEEAWAQQLQSNGNVQLLAFVLEHYW